MQITLIRRAKMKKTDRREGTKGTLIHAWWGCQWVQLFWKTVRQCLPKLNISKFHEPATPPVGTEPTEMYTKNMSKNVHGQNQNHWKHAHDSSVRE